MLVQHKVFCQKRHADNLAKGELAALGSAHDASCADRCGPRCLRPRPNLELPPLRTTRVMDQRERLRMLLPLAVLTATGMLAMDLYLPAVPALQSGLGMSIAQAQTTVAVFLAGLAASQLVWGELLQRLGPRLCIGLGTLGLVIGSFGCATAQQLELLLPCAPCKG